jgi:hypothetical protein
MSDATGRLLNRPQTLGDALAALPLHAPSRGVWAELANELALTRSKRWRYSLPAAVAAMLALCMAWPLRHEAPTPRGLGPTIATVMPSEQLDVLRRRSESLEHWLRFSDTINSARNAQDLVASSEIEDMIGLVDVQLGAQSDAATALPLWRQRVALLEDLTALRYTDYTLAASNSGWTEHRID